MAIIKPAHGATNWDVQLNQVIDRLNIVALYRLVQDEIGGYPTRPDSGYVDWLGWSDPGGVMLPGDTWTEISSPDGGNSGGGGSEVGGAELFDTFTRSDGAAWSTSVWSDQMSSGLSCDVQSNQGRALITGAGVFEDRRRMFLPGPSANWRARGQIATVPSLSGWAMDIVIQATDWQASNPATAYVLHLTNSTYYIVKRVDQSNTVVVSTQTLVGAKWWDIKIVDGVLKYRIWQGTLGDAPSWTTPSNVSPITGTGMAGIVLSSGDTSGTLDMRVDEILIDTDPVA